METNVSKIKSVSCPEITPPTRAARGQKWKCIEEKIRRQCKGPLPIINRLLGPLKLEQYSPQKTPTQPVLSPGVNRRKYMVSDIVTQFPGICSL